MTEGDIPEVGLSLAFSWTCPSCGTRQYVDAVFAEMTEEDRAEAIADGEEPPVTGEWVTNPDTVTCIKCSVTCEAKNSGQHAPA